ncbi:hypothetical protein HT031_005909 [Scenedesmus sp. PABB004]|nr:hypothetical protein HT031_005909 [Scenedesmus sp. PABB004]
MAGRSKAIAIGWQRGKRRRGATASVLPLPSKDGGGTVVRFNEKFMLTSSLYRAPGADRNSQLGPFKKKVLILAVLETDGRTHATSALGRVVVDLAEFASIDGQELRTFAVACNKAIHSAVGEPQLTLTVRCHWAKAGVDMTEDEVASMSTDTTGSGLASGIRGLFGRMRAGKAKRGEEQDLHGFAGGGGAEGMATIGEEGEDGGAPRRGGAAGDASLAGGFVEAEEVDFDSNRGSLDGSAGWGAAELEYDAVGALNLHDDDDEPPRQPHASGGGAAAASAAAAAGRRSAGATAAAPAGPADTSAPATPSRRWRGDGADGAAGSAASSERGVVSPAPRAGRQGRSTSTQTDLADVHDVAPQLDDVTHLQDELLMAAAAEFAIYNAQRALLPGRSAARSVHAPARRIARTLVCLGRQDGLPFGLLALRQVSASVVAGRGDIGGLAFWWTNSVHLRGFLQSLNLALASAADDDDDAPRHWAAAELVPRLLQQEKFIFDELVSYVWTHTFVPAVAASRARPASMALAAGVVKRAGQEAAMRKWIAALEAVAAQLRGLGREGHVSTLRHQVLLEVLKRMDVLIFHCLLAPPPGSDDGSSSGGAPLPSPGASGGGWGAGDGPGPSPRPGAGVLFDPLNPNMPVLDDSMLFFGRGALSFGTGMHLKMAATRFQQWAFGEGGMREIWANLPAQGQSLFPLLRATSDLLMMPKDLLLEPGIREDMCDNLPLGTLVYMLTRFAPDDFSREGIPFEVLAALRAEAADAAPRGGDPAALAAALGTGPPRLVVEAECTYYSPTDDMAMEKVEVGEEPGLEYDADSEDELDALGGLCADTTCGTGPPLRFKLLHNLWSAGVPRSRRITMLRADSADPSGHLASAGAWAPASRRAPAPAPALLVQRPAACRLAALPVAPRRALAAPVLRGLLLLAAAAGEGGEEAAGEEGAPAPAPAPMAEESMSSCSDSSESDSSDSDSDSDSSSSDDSDSECGGGEERVLDAAARAAAKEERKAAKAADKAERAAAKEERKAADKMAKEERKAAKAADKAERKVAKEERRLEREAQRARVIQA